LRAAQKNVVAGRLPALFAFGLKAVTTVGILPEANEVEVSSTSQPLLLRRMTLLGHNVRKRAAAALRHLRNNDHACAEGKDSHFRNFVPK
jgi:hypothetical protein